MFTRAGFNARADRLGIRAAIHRAGWSWPRAAELIRFRPSGDLCWYGAGGLSWGTCSDLSFKNWIHLSGQGWFDRQLAACDLTTRKRIKVYA